MERLLAKLKKLGFSKAGWATSGRFSVLIASVALHALLSHILTPQEYGSYLLLVSVILGTSLIGLSGSDKIIVRFIAEELAHGRAFRAAGIAKQVLATVLIRGGIIGLIMLCAFYVLGLAHATPNLHTFEPITTTFFLLWVPGSILSLIIPEIFRGYQDIKSASIFSSIPGILNIIGIVFLQSIGVHSLQSAVVCTSIATLIATVLGTAFLIRLSLIINPDTTRTNHESPYADPRSLRSYSLLVTDAFFFIFGNLGIWLLAYFTDQQSVAAYGAASRLASLVALPIVIANLILPPIIAQKASQQRTQELEETLRITATLTTLPALALFVVYCGLGRDILGIIFGPYYSSSNILLIILSVGQVASVALGSCGFALVMTGNQRLAMGASTVSSLIVILTSLALVIGYGAVGMATAATIGMILQNIFYLAAVKWRLGIWTHLRFTIPRSFQWS